MKRSKNRTGWNLSLMMATWLCVTVASVSVVAEGELPAGPALAKPQLPGQPVPEASRDVRAIEGVRERLGGSVLKGTRFEGTMDSAEFRRLATEWEKEWMERPSTMPGVHDVPGISGPSFNTPSSTRHYPQAPVQYSESLDPLQAATEQLRASARNLDLLAADLEDAGKFKEADRLRASAQNLRREARDFSRQTTVETSITR